MKIKINHSIHSPFLFEVPSALHSQEEFAKKTSLITSGRDGFHGHEHLFKQYEEEAGGILLRFFLKLPRLRTFQKAFLISQK